MRKFMIALFIILLTVPCVSHAKKDKDKGHHKNKKVTICHKGKNITISENAVQAHLNHGDAIGPCAPVSHHVEQKQRHDYFYYPNACVYFDKIRNLYFYMNNGKWLSVATLPNWIDIQIDTGIKVDIDDDKPYTHHQRIVKKHPPVAVKIYNYKFYPRASVYFDIDRKIYFMFNGHEWTMSGVLPKSIRLDPSRSVDVMIGAQNPAILYRNILK